MKTPLTDDANWNEPETSRTSRKFLLKYVAISYRLFPLCVGLVYCHRLWNNHSASAQKLYPSSIGFYQSLMFWEMELNNQQDSLVCDFTTPIKTSTPLRISTSSIYRWSMGKKFFIQYNLHVWYSLTLLTKTYSHSLLDFPSSVIPSCFFDYSTVIHRYIMASTLIFTSVHILVDTWSNLC